MSFRFLKSQNLENIIYKADTIYTGIDYLRFTLKTELKYFEDIMNKLDGDNSNDYVDEENMITRTKVKMSLGWSLIGTIAYESFAFSTILYTVFDRQDLFKSYGKIDLYGMYYRMVELGYLEHNFIENLLNSTDVEVLNTSKITRLDYKFDFCYNDSKMFPPLKALINPRANGRSYRVDKISQSYLKGDEIQSLAYGSKSSKRVFTRMYNKIDDISSKGKYALYRDYFNYADVHRLEFKLLNHFCKPYTYKNYYEIVEKLLKILNLQYQGKLYQSNNKETDLSIMSQRLRYFRDFIGRGFKIYKSGYNPFITLLEGLREKEVKEQ